MCSILLSHWVSVQGLTGKIIEIAKGSSRTLLELNAMSEDDLRLLFYPKSPGRKRSLGLVEPDYGVVVAELSMRGVTRALLYNEYLKEYGDRCFSYSMFCQKLRSHQNSSALSMRMVYEPGKWLFVDYAGDKVPIYDVSTGEILYEAEIFVATLAYSGYTYFEAHRSQDSLSFASGLNRAFGYIGGTPKVIVPDNLKAGVITNSKSDLKLNRTLLELAEHYTLFVDPARIKKPRDKGKVEERVGYIQRHAIAALRNTTFYSLAELNTALRPMVDEINNLDFTKMSGSRATRFQEERESLKTLALLPFSFGIWTQIKVPSNYHISVDGCDYSVPYSLRNLLVDIKVTTATIEVFYHSERVAMHQRQEHPRQHVTLEAHLHPSHKAYQDGLNEDVALAKAKKVGESTCAMAKVILENCAVGETGIASVNRMLRLSDTYGRDELELACSYGIKIGATSRSSIGSILRGKTYEFSITPSTDIIDHANLRGSSYYAEKGEDAYV